MTKNRNLKAAVRKFAQKHSVSYVEARRLMGLDVLTFEFTGADGVQVEAEIAGNGLEVRWLNTDGTEDLRSTHLSNLLGAGVWGDSYNPAFKADGRMEGYERSFLEAVNVDRIRTWASSHVKAPTVLSVDDQDFVDHISIPWDQLYTVIDRQRMTATVHVVRLPPEPPTSMFSMDVFAWQKARYQLGDDLFYTTLEPDVDITDDERYRQIVSGAALGISLSDALAQHRKYAAEEWSHEVDPNPNQLTWSVVELSLKSKPGT